MSSPKTDKPNTVCHGSKDDGSNNHEESTTVESGAYVDDTSLSSQGDNSASIFRPSSSDSRQGSSHSIQIDDSNNISRNYENEPCVSGDQTIAYVQTGIKALNITGTPKLEKNESRGERPHSFPTSFVQHQMHQPTATLQYQSSIPQIVSHVTNASYAIPNHGGKFFSTEAQPVLHSSGFTPPLYATPATSYMHSANPYYAGVQQPGVVYPPQYGIGGYPYNPGVVPYISGYPTHNAVPLSFDGSTSTGSDINTHGTWGSGSQGVDMQHMNRFYGFSPPVVDPRMQFHPSYGDFCNIPGQVDPLALRGGVIERQVSGYDSHIGSDFAPALPGHGPQHQLRGTFSGIDYGASSTNAGFFTHITNSSLASPVLPGSPIGGVRSVGSPHSGRSGSPYGSWQGHRGFENFSHQKSFSFLEELKSGKGKRFDLSDIVDHVVDFSVDQHGSRFIQQKLENCSVEDKQSVFREVLPHASKLMSDVFGNYVIQKFFEYGTPDQRRDLANALKGQILQLSLQMYGCRVIQKALDVIEVDQKTELVHELDGHVMRCVRDQNGNHVIQKCIECIPSERIGFIISSFRGQVASLSMHPYGCRVIQRILERCTTELETQFIVDEILESVCTLAQDQYGNYVTQHVLEKGKPHERLQIVKNLTGKVVQMSQHKFASNVIEKCLDHGDAAARELLIGEIIGQNEGNDNLLVMMKDQYANYVVQKILETCTDSQRDLLIGRIRVHLQGLKKYTYGKHIVARFEKLFGEMEAPGS